MLRSQAQQGCSLIENLDPGLSDLSYQTVFVTVVDKKDKFNIKFWKFKNKFTISCFVVTKDTFCVDQRSAVTFTFNDSSRFSFISEKKQNCHGELDKDYLNEETNKEILAFETKEVVSIDVKALHSDKSFVVDEKTAGSLQQAFRCITEKKM